MMEQFDESLHDVASLFCKPENYFHLPIVIMMSGRGAWRVYLM